MIKVAVPVAFAAAVVLLGTLTGCGGDADPVTPPTAVDVADCDADDRRKREVPDCGFKAGGRYIEWSWVTQGKKTPPAGWRADLERKTVTVKPAPKAKVSNKPASGR